MKIEECKFFRYFYRILSKTDLLRKRIMKIAAEARGLGSLRLPVSSRLFSPFFLIFRTISWVKLAGA